VKALCWLFGHRTVVTGYVAQSPPEGPMGRMLAYRCLVCGRRFAGLEIATIRHKVVR
jgi:hypothetical protein